MRPWWIMLDGIGPGVGKSTLASGLAASLPTGGFHIELVPEEAVFERSEFAPAAAEFRSQRFARESSLLDAYSALANTADTTFVFDWSCAAMAEDLPWATEQEALDAHVAAVSDIAGSFNKVLLYLDAPIGVALRRAVAERGNEWLHRYASLAPTIEPEGPVSRIEEAIERAARYYTISDSSWRRSLKALTRAEWRISRVDATKEPQGVLSEVLRAITSP